ncbi:MAG: hypothetical protein KGO82_00125 [Bacteroidota bacterium]|nr:hypothetical protein [Bacteroidota bacterium]
MKTTTMQTAGAILSAGILLTSCVSSKKYHRSQDEVARLRTDSTTLAQKDSTLTQNLNAVNQKNSELQQSIETANNTNASLQKNVAFYSDNVNKAKTTADQIKGELSTTLASAGLSDQDIAQTDAKVMINLNEKNLFKGNSAVLTTKGKELVNSIGEYVKGREGIDVSVADLETANGTMTASGMSSGSDMNSSSSSSNTNNTARSGNPSDNDNTVTNTTGSRASSSANHTRMRSYSTKRSATTHKSSASRSTAKSSGSRETRSTAYSSGKRKSSAITSARARKAMAWQRQNAVANALLATGLPKVKVVAQNESMSASGSGDKGVQVVLAPDMDNFYKTMSEAPAAQATGTKNP